MSLSHSFTRSPPQYNIALDSNGGVDVDEEVNLKWYHDQTEPNLHFVLYNLIGVIFGWRPQEIGGGYVNNCVKES